MTATADPQLSLLAREQRREWTLAQDLESLAAIALKLAAKAGPEGISTEDVRVTAIARGRYPGSTDRGYLSRLWGSVMKHAGLEVIPGKRVKTPRRGRRGGNEICAWKIRGAA